MKKIILVLSMLLANVAWADNFCPTGQVLTEDGCKGLIEQPQAKAALANDPRLTDPRCFDDGEFEPFDDDCTRVYPELTQKRPFPAHFDDDRYETWDD
ncbi:hypothetical protein DBZ36_10430 [Alginatibacterium sediminis]|uniref:Uncharacterized protein n=1 Tax=Alginatibacterium sediminis TaxID=2164068 RepID=A0A420EDQ4_9ALTE|nr:hypothetical protein [Alginatibacterium sediminis]RKF18800.1 hypothetical protein DBZ36_10430 [Alginatibacterium sediminis]